MIERISYRQLFFISFMSQMTLAVSALLSLTSYDTGHDAWIAALLTGLGSPLISWSIMTLAMRFPGETPVEYAPRILGKPLGVAVTALILLFLLERMAFAMRTFGGMLTSTIYIQTPVIVLMLLGTLVCATGARYGIEVIARLADLFTPVFLGITLIVIAASAQQWDVRWLRPVLARGIVPPLLGAVTPVSIFVEQLYLSSSRPTLMTCGAPVASSHGRASPSPA